MVKEWRVHIIDVSIEDGSDTNRLDCFFIETSFGSQIVVAEG